MATKIRLLLDFLIQVFVFIFFIAQLVLYPEQIWLTAGLFAMSISAWQILHALYVVRKYQDWERRRYLGSMRQVLAYAFFTLLIGGLMLVASFGFLFPFLIFVIDVLYIVVCAVVLVLAVLYFAQSLRNLYLFYHRPRSFWDL
jgi:hypothetical protein